MLLLVAAVAAWLTAGHAAAQKVLLPGIGEHDHRVPVDNSRPPWSAIGRVNRRSGGYCTGSVIGARRVVTAAHCLWSPRTKSWLPHQAFHFVAGYRQGEYLADAEVSSFAVAPGYDPKAPTAASNLARDWAVLTLDRDVGAVVGTLPLYADRQGHESRPTVGTRLIHAGYSQDRAHVLTKHDGCVVTVPPTDFLLRHDCDATHGDSGSPVLVAEGGRLMLLAVHVASAMQGGHTAGLAAILPAELP